MIKSDRTYDLAIIGGGLAGLSLAIQSARSGISTVLFEKESYPRHKVCGEFISNESRQFMQDLGVDFHVHNFPEINTFRLSDSFGNISKCRLNPGGFGMSRFFLDDALFILAKDSGAEVFQKSMVRSIEGGWNTGFNIEATDGFNVSAKMVVGAWGRNGALNKGERLKTTEPWIGVKYHVCDGPSLDTIEIHAFEDGYAGISAIEDNKYCLAYLCKAKGLKSYGSDIRAFEDAVLSQNKRLAARLDVERLMGPITTSQFYFGVNEVQPYPFIGDAGGFIPPLTGNGMSLAFRSSKHLFQLIQKYQCGSISQESFLAENDKYLKGYLRTRVNRGVLLQNLLFVRPKRLNQAMMKLFSISPFALRTMSKLAVGDTI